MGLALNHLQRQAIRLDPEWNGGQYSTNDPPAREWRWPERSPCAPTSRRNCSTSASAAIPTATAKIPGLDLRQNGRFDVAGYLDYQGRKFVERFDANSYLAITPNHGHLRPGPRLRFTAGRL